MEKLIEQNQKWAGICIILALIVVIFIPVSPWDALDVLLTLVCGFLCLISGVASGISTTLIKMNQKEE